MVTAKEVREYGEGLGLDIVRIASAEPFPDYPKAVKERLAKGLIPPESIANEEILRRCEEFADPRTSLPGARSIVVMAMCYNIEGARVDPDDPTPRGRIARQTWRDFYDGLHVQRDKLARFLAQKGARCSQKPLLPLKQAAVRAGVGRYGSNCVIQTERWGSWVVLDAVVTDADLEVDKPAEKTGCGRCRACIEACPTGALVAPYTLDIGRCLTHLLASVHPIPPELRSKVGDSINGCDRCQEACPRNWDVPFVKREVKNHLGEWGERPALAPLLDVGEKEFMRSFADLDWYTNEPVHLHRNAIVAMGNVGGPVSVPVLGRALQDKRPMLRAHAAWALGRIGGASAKRLLNEAAKLEDDEAVAEEIDSALEGL